MCNCLSWACGRRGRADKERFPMVDIPLSDFRKMAIEEFDTTKLLKHAAQQASERGYDKFPIVDVDSHHYELESLGEILEYMDDPVLQRLAMSATNGGGRT